MTTTTIVILIVAAASLIAWDIYAALNRKPGDTISEVMLDAGKRVAGLPFVFGVLAAHLFMPHNFKVLVQMPWAGFILGFAFIVVTVAGILVRREWSRFPITWPAFVLGVLAGLALWPQR